MKVIIVLITSLSLLVACTNETDKIIQMPKNQLTIAEKILNDYCTRSGVTRSDGNSIGSLKIENLEVKTYYFDGRAAHEVTKSTRSNADNAIYEVCRADFKSDSGTNGYAYLSTTTGKAGVYFFTPNGEISDTTYNEGLKIVLGNIPRAIGGVSENNPGKLDSVCSIGTGILLKTTWGQDSPFNDTFPLCSCESCVGNKKICIVGCTNVAVGQVIAYCKRFAPELEVNKDINFRRLTLFPKPKTEEDKYQISNFLYEVAIRNKSTLTHSSSKASVFSANALLQACGYKTSFVCGYLDPQRLNKSLLFKHIPCIYSGYNDDLVGHVWVIDGCYIENDVYYYHCNWGWAGLSDCWTVYESIADPGITKPFDKKYEDIVIYINEF